MHRLAELRRHEHCKTQKVPHRQEPEGTRIGAKNTIDAALEKLENKFGKDAVISGRKLELMRTAPYLVTNKAKCPFTPQREMQLRLDGLDEQIAET